MPVRAVRLKIRVRLSNGSRSYVDPVYSANGKLKPLYALVNGKPEHHPEGVYNLRYVKADLSAMDLLRGIVALSPISGIGGGSTAVAECASLWCFRIQSCSVCRGGFV